MMFMLFKCTFSPRRCVHCDTQLTDCHRAVFKGHIVGEARAFTISVMKEGIKHYKLIKS